MTKTLISWNVNGIRAVLGKNFWEFFEEYQPDILCLQETKAQQDQVDIEIDGYYQYWNSAEKKGYSGTAIFTSVKPKDVRYGLGVEEHDNEGRVLTLEFDKFFLVTVYTPNSQTGLKRLDYRTKEWDKAFLSYVKKLDKSKPVVFCGDLNVAHKEIDIANPAANVKNAGFTPQERANFTKIVQSGFVDTFRIFNQDPQNYTWWSYRTRARERNVGWRIDYFCVSERIQDRVADARILSDVMGSDHCPVAIDLEKLW
ncbi:exodeoxyribonuclease III [Pseudobacteriovorax antillogorgiicola]|uniref:Exodeoxyribonuclease-3 n=1 Tax=Pseudobacteriovorax antillogorgiicola TaxID=1513793 RepID=A0A1Y6CQT0_9BACT|nr:exodeoxyribonuclease III [Pseudobacteriovorax antillogorgiicola]TCS45847.1 exodeoxyribonuclease-3 [Pseudobacteriovorax antillogorgiicola]SMF71794.1 exodeoxyribonuclease-3 [Pseudobacteriovorax antillogorgiicola]